MSQLNITSDTVLRFAVNGRELTVYVNNHPNEEENKNCAICGGTGTKNLGTLSYTYEILEIVEDGVQLSLEDNFFQAVKAAIDAVGYFGKAYCTDCYGTQLKRLNDELEEE